MKPIYERHISTLTVGLSLGYVRSLPSVVSLACPRCGLKVSARKEAGTSGFAFEIDLDQRRSLPSRHVVVLTLAGNLSISCESSALDAAASPISSGGVSGTSYSTANSDAREAQPCGCDPGCRLPPGAPTLDYNRFRVHHYVCAEFPNCPYGRSL